MDCSPPGSSVHRISQARILEWVASSFSKGSSQPRDQTSVSHIAGRFFTAEPPRKAIKGPFKNPPLCITVMSYLTFMLSVFWKKNVKMNWYLQIQMSGPNGMMYMSVCVCMCTQLCPTLCDLCLWDLSDKNTEWVAISSSRGSSWPRDRTCISCVSCIGKSRFFTNWAIRDVYESMF